MTVDVSLTSLVKDGVPDMAGVGGEDSGSRAACGVDIAQWTSWLENEVLEWCWVASRYGGGCEKVADHSAMAAL